MKNADHNYYLRPMRIRWTIGGLSIVLIMTVLWLALVGSPMLDDQKEQLAQFAAIESFGNTAQSLSANFEQVSAETRDWQIAEKLRHDRASPLHDEAMFFQWSNQQALDCGLEVRDFRPASRELLADYESRGVMLSTHGSFEAIGRFLDRLRDCPCMNRVTSMEIVPRDAQCESFGVTLQIVLFTSRSKPLITAPSQGISS